MTTVQWRSNEDLSQSDGSGDREEGMNLDEMAIIKG